MNTYTKIPNYNYGINKKGEVFSYKSNKVLKPAINGAGYLSLSLYNSLGRKTYCIHQLMGITYFNYNLKGFEEVVNHKDGNKLNNNISNLEITTNRINISKGYKNKSSKYIGVTWDKKNKKWLSQGRLPKGNLKNLGRYVSELDAKIAYVNFINNI